MSEAIENAKCVLLCVTEKYRQSVPCQLEAKYAMKLNKIIIPCIMQKGYGQIQGWLGMIMMDLIYIDFIKYDLDIAIEKLLNQINLRNNVIKNEVKEYNSAEIAEVQAKNSENVSTTLGPFIESKNSDNKVKSARKVTAKNRDIISNESKGAKEKSPTDNWSEGDVEAWFKKHDLEEILEYLQPLDGKVLSQLNEIRIHTPEFFFKSLMVYPNTDMKSVALFSSLLKDLYIQ